MRLFVVIQLGVYRHDVVGVFSTSDKAIEAATSAILAESDDYHDFEILEHNLDSSEVEREFCVVSRNDGGLNRVDTTAWVRAMYTDGTVRDLS